MSDRCYYGLNNVALRCLIAGLVILASGCGKSGPPTSRVEGSVTLDGKPLEKGTISFVCLENDRGGSAAGKIVAGKYDVADVPRGKVRVGFHAVRSTGRMTSIPGGPPMPEIINVIPEKYRMGVEVEVAEPNVHRDFQF